MTFFLLMSKNFKISHYCFFSPVQFLIISKKSQISHDPIFFNISQNNFLLRPNGGRGFNPQPPIAYASGLRSSYCVRGPVLKHPNGSSRYRPRMVDKDKAILSYEQKSNARDK